MIVPREEDFAFSLRDRMATARGRKRDRSSIPTIGVVTGGDVLVDRSDLVRLISFWTSNNREQRVRFVHIPQSFSYVSYRNNDTIVGLKIEAEIKSFLQERSLLFKTLPYENNIDKLFDTYLHLDGVISERLHGLIFAHMANLPLMAITGGHPKFQSFCEDYKNDQIFQVDNNNFIDQSFREMLTMVMR
jgi:polysaccharide pyruvyl transferase WcaK-like protein